MPWAPDLRLGPYTLLAPVGSGGMGEVWKARDMRLNRTVAIKRLKQEHSARFEREARAIAALNHPHICQIYDVGPDYFVMEYIDGVPFKGPLPPDEAVRLAIQILSALEDAHQKSILHRDLKPANILITTRGEAKLLDFGLAKEFSNAEATQTLEGVVMGTIPYMSPEQAEGRPLDARSEIFSFGAVLYQTLSGARAFSSLGAVLRDDPPPLKAPEPLKNIIERCMKKDPAQRFQTVAELKAALEKLALKPATGQASIAVLPFANMSRDADDEYFSDGLAEEIINALAKIPDLKVIARTSAFAFKGQNTDIRRIAETLGVTSILEGSVRRAGPRVRITAQLINAQDGSHLWSERYDREMADIFAVQDEISAAIAAALHIRLSPTVLPKRRYQPKLPAYEACLRARHTMMKATPDAFSIARQGFEQAIALDPGFAGAYLLSASIFVANSVLGIQPAHEAMPHARKLALQALVLDPDSSEAQAMLGSIAAQYDYDWPEAERRFQRALSYTPISSEVHRAYGFSYLLCSGRPAEAVEELLQAVLEDPLFPVTRHNYGMCLAAANRLPEAIEEITKLQELDAAFWPAHLMLSLLNWLQGNLAQALIHAERAYQMAPWSIMACTGFAGTLAAAGQPERAAELISKLHPDTYGVPMALTTYHVMRGEFDIAAEWYVRAIEQRDPRVLPVRYLLGSEFRSSAHWPRLAKMMNLPQTMTTRSF